MTTQPILTLSPPPPVPARVLHLDKLGVDLPTIAPSYGQRIIGHIEARGSSHPVPAVVVRRGTL